MRFVRVGTVPSGVIYRFAFSPSRVAFFMHDFAVYVCLD